MRTSAFCLLGLLQSTPLLAAATASDNPPAALAVDITPTAKTLNVKMTIAGPPFRKGEPLVTLPLTMVGVPTARYDGAALRANDRRGAVPLVQDELPTTPQGVIRRWKVLRDTDGPVVVTFAAPPRDVSATTRNGPLFDLRRDGQSFMGAGVGFMATPARSTPYEVHLRWKLPPGWRGIWSLGTGDVDTVVPPELLAYSYYAVGPLQSFPTTDDAAFGLYWSSPPPFDAAELGRYIRGVYAKMADFFGVPADNYRVFLRQSPYAGIEGTALAQSFMVGYQASAKPTVESLRDTLAHEITHNWLEMEGEHGEKAWFLEGSAEYYSVILPYRAGLLSVDQFTTLINQKAQQYYKNKFRTTSNADLTKLFWSDLDAQNAPYGRGFIYLLRTDAAIRVRSGGRKSLDDVVLALRKRQTSSQSYGVADWLKLVGAELGEDVAKRDYQDMMAGKLMDLPADRFAPCLVVVRDGEQSKEGKVETWAWKRATADTARCTF